MTPDRSTTLQQMARHPGVNEHHKLDSVGGGDDKGGGCGEVGGVIREELGRKVRHKLDQNKLYEIF